MAIEPTIPATDVRTGVPDFSSERPTDDAGPGRGTIGVVVGVVVIVGVLFLWLGGSKPVPAAATTAAGGPAASPAPAAAAKSSTSASKPAAKPAARPTPAAKPTPAAPAAAAPVAAPASDGASATAAQSAPAPSHAHVAAAHKRHKKPTARAAKHKEVKLPRLPSPPPADP